MGMSKIIREKEKDKFKNKYMDRILHKKNIFESIEIIEELNKERSIDYKKEATLKKRTPKGFFLEFEANRVSYNYDLDDISNITFNIGDKTINVEKLHIIYQSPPLIKGRIHTFSSINFDKTSSLFYRLIIPLKKGVDFHFYIEQSVYETDKHYSRECLQANFEDGIDFHLYLYKNRKEESIINYLIIDTIKELPYEMFADYCYSLLVSLGYVTGSFPQNEGYFFSYETIDMRIPKQFLYSEFRDSIYSFYSPIYSNAHGYIRDNKIAEDEQKGLRVMTSFEFSTLCRKVHYNNDFLAILLLILESSTSSLLVMPSGFSIALEGLTELYVEENEEKVAPINNKKQAKNLRKELMEILDSHKDIIGEDAISIISKRIDNINQPTNQDKLIKPFELLNFKLTEDDKKAINHRNDFLHGRITLSSDDDSIGERKTYHIALRLYTLLSVLILKSIGYNGKILNYPKIHESASSDKIIEPYYRQI